ncbi:hypothetical protein EUGRSUZ_D00972 [Eucalyptus grandis]|uniref:Uncharacterized protein n=2 Tax=Eucalyptus grandis TaxID=71139 RepID=A0ACC3L5E7_EUCGR|nr:hypothetical protein EUGRSUZ_D00972 [Eucalyptus grandis]
MLKVIYRNIDLQNICLTPLTVKKLRKKNRRMCSPTWMVPQVGCRSLKLSNCKWRCKSAYMNSWRQRQLQLRIEAQGKYLKKIIEEQQRLSGALADGSADESGDKGQEDSKTDPPTPAPISESPIQDKSKDCAVAKSLSLDGSLSSHNHEPLTPDSGCNVSSPAESPDGERSAKKPRVTAGASHAKPEIVLHPIFESSLGCSYTNSSFKLPDQGSV